MISNQSLRDQSVLAQHGGHIRPSLLARNDNLRIVQRHSRQVAVIEPRREMRQPLGRRTVSWLHGSQKLLGLLPAIFKVEAIRLRLRRRATRACRASTESASPNRIKDLSAGGVFELKGWSGCAVAAGDGDPSGECGRYLCAIASAEV